MHDALECEASQWTNFARAIIRYVWRTFESVCLCVLPSAFVLYNVRKREIERTNFAHSIIHISPPKMLCSVRVCLSVSVCYLHFIQTRSLFVFASRISLVFRLFFFVFGACVSVFTHLCVCKPHRFAKNGFSNRMNGENQDLSLVIFACIETRTFEFERREYCVRYRHRHSRIAKI